MFGYQVPEADQAMIISGGKAESDGAPFKVVVGRGAWIVPLFRQCSFLTLAMQESEIEEQCVTKQGIALQVKAVIAFKVGTDPASIVNAAQRFLSDQAQMEKLTGRIFAGHLRSIIGSMTVEEIITERQKLASEILEGSKTEMGTLGLVVDALQIQSIDDLGAGYITAIAAPHNASIQQAAKIAQAKANEAAAAAEQESERKQAEYERDTSLQRAKFKAEQDKALAEANQAGPLQDAESQRAVTVSQTELAAKQADLRQQQLEAEVIRPAEADAQKIEVMAEAEAKATELQATAAASSDRISLDRMLIEQLPQIVREAGMALGNAEVNILSGADGLAEMTAGLAAQGTRILQSAKLALQEQQLPEALPLR